MNYDEAMTSIVTRAQALAELRRHGADLAEFLDEVGDHDTYEGEQVLNWLGY